MFRAPCAHHQEVKIAWHSLWYHHTYRWPSRAQVMQFWPHDDEHICSKHVESRNKTYCETNLCIKLVKYWDMFCGCFNLFVMCGWVYVRVFWQLCGCFGNICTSIYCFVLSVLCFCLASFMYIYSCFVRTSVRTTASTWKQNYYYYYYHYCCCCCCCCCSSSSSKITNALRAEHRNQHQTQSSLASASTACTV